MDRKVIVFIGIIVLLIFVFYDKEIPLGEQYNFISPDPNINNIHSQADIRYEGEIVGSIFSSDIQSSVVLKYDPTRALCSTYPSYRPIQLRPFFPINPYLADNIMYATEGLRCILYNQFLAEYKEWCGFEEAYYIYVPSLDSNESKYRVQFYLNVNGVRYPLYKELSTCPYAAWDYSGVYDVYHYCQDQLSSACPTSPVIPRVIINEKVRSVSLEIEVYESEYVDYSIGSPFDDYFKDWVKIFDKTLDFSFEVSTPTVSIKEVTEDTATISVEGGTQYDKVTLELYHEGNVIETKEIATESTTTFENLERATNYTVNYTSHNYYGIINGALEFTTLGEVIPVKIIPLSTEITENSFLQTFLVEGDNPEIEITLVHGTTVETMDYQYDGEKYLTRFSYLEPSTTYSYTIKAYEYGHETENYDIYTNTFRTSEETDSTTKVIIEESYLKDKKFYMKFKIDGSYNDKVFAYMVEGGEIRNVNITKFGGYYSLKTPELDEGDYEWRLLVTTDEGDIIKEGTFKVYETVPTYTPPPIGSPQINGETNWALIICIIIVIAGIIWYFRKK